jgi:hypothetical protein
MAKKLSLLVVIFLGFYLAAHLWVRFQKQGGAPVEASRLVNCIDNQVRGITIDSKEGDQPVHMVFQRTDQQQAGVPPAAQMAFSEWQYVEPYKGIEADASALVRMASVLCDIYNPSAVPSGEELGAPTGPVTAVEFKLSMPAGEEIHHLTFGKTTADRNLNVEYKGPSGAVRMVRLPAKLPQLAAVPAKDFRNLRVLRMPADLAEVVSLFDGKGNERFSLERAGSGWAVKTAGRTAGVGNDDAEKFVNRLGSLRALDTEPRAAGPCPESPKKLELRLKGLANREETISIDYGKDGPLRICNSARPAYFTVHRDLLPFLDVKPESLAVKKQN